METKNESTYAHWTPYQESIDLLAHATGLDSGVVPAGLVEAAKLCGRLPLCLNMAAQVFARCVTHNISRDTCAHR